VISLKVMEGSLDNEKYGRQFLEMGKQIFEAVNKQANSEVGYFKFEPSRTASPQNSEFASWWNWDVSVNLAYGEQSLKFSQSLNYKNKISYSGRFWSEVPASMTLAVTCNDGSKKLFQDLGYPNEPCITQTKVSEMQKRLEAEYNRKQPLLDKLYQRYLLAEITQEQYDRAINLLNGVSTKESLIAVPAPKLVTNGFSENFLPAEQIFVLGLSDCELEQMLEEAMLKNEV
jgi:hypothetical protein